MRTARRIAWLLLAAVVPACAAPAPDGLEGSDWKRTNGAMHERLAANALRQGRFADAAANAREALRVDGANRVAALVLSEAELRMGDARSAEEAARAALALGPQQGDAWLLLGECLMEQERGAAAEDAFARAADLGSADASLLLGAMALEAGDVAAGERLLGPAPEDDPGAPGWRGGSAGARVLAGHRFRAGRHDEARSILRRALERSPGDASLQAMLARFAVADGSEPSAAAAAGVATVTTGEERLLAAAAAVQRGEFERAAEQYRAVSRVEPGNAFVRLSLGEALLETGDFEGAEAAFSAAVRIDPRSRLAHEGIGRARLRAGRPGDALEALERAVLLSPREPAAHALVALAAARDGDRERASAAASEVSLLDPGGPLDQACRRLLARTEGRTAENVSGRP